MRAHKDVASRVFPDHRPKGLGCPEKVSVAMVGQRVLEPGLPDPFVLWEEMDEPVIFRGRPGIVTGMEIGFGELELFIGIDDPGVRESGG
jgi:hypothetical protein